MPGGLKRSARGAISLAGLLGSLSALAGATRASGPQAPAPNEAVLQVRVTEKGIEPSPVKVKKGQPLDLKVTRTTDQTCATELVVPDYHVQVQLPLNKPVDVRFTPTKTGELSYGCAMGMMVRGVLQVE